jgi:hypothetical protein
MRIVIARPGYPDVEFDNPTDVIEYVDGIAPEEFHQLVCLVTPGGREKPTLSWSGWRMIDHLRELDV